MINKTVKKPWFKPAIGNPYVPCPCCKTPTEILDMKTELWGCWTISKNGEGLTIDYTDKPLSFIEEFIGEDNENNYTAHVLYGLHDETYQRHVKNTWVLIAQGPGYA
jgi:hypothetical protein